MIKKRKGRVKKEKPNLINDEIKFNSVKLVGDNVESDVYELKEALRLGDDMEMDLVLINDKIEPPICKLMDYEKYLYELKKSRKPQKTLPLKEVKFGPNISGGDLDNKVGQICKFLDKGHKVKAYVQFRGREMAFTDNGKKVLLEVAQRVQEHGTPESLPDKVQGRKMHMYIKPKNN